MTDLLKAQADILVSHCLNPQGAVDQDLVNQTMVAFRSSRVKHKTQVLRYLKQSLGRLQSQQQATVISSSHLPEALRQQLTTYITHTYPQVKTFVWQVNPDLIGGFTILVGDMWHDSSIAHQLQTIREQLTQ